MERVLFLVLFMISASAQADVVLSSPDRFNPWEEQYPHSTWGTEPAQVELKTSVVNRGRSLASEPAGPEADPFAPSTKYKFADPSREPANVLPERQKGVQEVSLIVSDLGYFPRAIFVNKSIPVRIFVTGSSKQSLCIMIDSFNVVKQVRASEVGEVTFTPNQAGQYRFHCPVNNLEGTIVVRDQSAEQKQGERQPASE